MFTDSVRAVWEMRTAVELRSHYAPALNQLGTLLKRSGDIQDAEAMFRRAIDAEPRYAFARFNLATVLLRRGARDEAIDQLRAGLAIQDDAHARELLEKASG